MSGAKEIVHATPTSVTKYIRDGSSKTATVQTTEFVGPYAERNKRIRLEGLMPQGKQLPVIGEDLRIGFSWPPVLYSNLKKLHPELWAGLHDRDPENNIIAAHHLAKIYPQFVVNEGDR